MNFNSPFANQHSYGGSPFGASGIAPFGQSTMQYGGAFGQPNNMTTAITNQKPTKVIYIDLNGNQKVFTQREDGEGYVEDADDERNRNAVAVKPILDIDNYDGFNYQPALDASQIN